MTVRAVLFDLDGTLIDSLEDLTAAVNHMLGSFGQEALTTDRVRRLVGRGARNLVQRALGSDEPETLDRAVTLFSDFNASHIADRSRVYPGVTELLADLKNNGIRLSVVSNKPAHLCGSILQTLGIAPFFDTVAGGDSYPDMKPSPLPLISICEQLGCGTAEAVMVGDSINDIEAGRRAGIATIGCSWGYGDSSELDGADFLAGTSRDIFDIIRRIRER